MRGAFDYPTQFHHGAQSQTLLQDGPFKLECMASLCSSCFEASCVFALSAAVAVRCALIVQMDMGSGPLAPHPRDYMNPNTG